MALQPLITAAELRTELTLATYMALFDEEQVGDIPTVDASPGVLMVLGDAHVLTIAWLPANYEHLPVASDPDVSQLLKYAERQYAKVLAYEKHDEYVRATGSEKKITSAFTRAEATMKRVQQAILRMPDSESMGKPENIGGIVTNDDQRVFLGSTGGRRNSGDF
jgi:hypothetical protein